MRVMVVYGPIRIQTLALKTQCLLVPGMQNHSILPQFKYINLNVNESLNGGNEKYKNTILRIGLNGVNFEIICRVTVSFA